MILENIEDVMKVLTAHCDHCWNFRGYDHQYSSVRKEGREAIFGCKHLDEFRALTTEFYAEQSDFDGLQEEISKLEERLSLRESLDFQAKAFREEYGELQSKIQIYAEFARQDFTTSLQGYCSECWEPRELTIRDRKLWIGCPPCASLIADSIGY